MKSRPTMFSILINSLFAGLNCFAEDTESVYQEGVAKLRLAQADHSALAINNEPVPVASFDSGTFKTTGYLGFGMRTGQKLVISCFEINAAGK